MTIPTMNEVMYPCLEFLREGASNARECLPFLQERFSLSKDQMDETIPSGMRTRLFDRADWAIFHLMKAGLVERPRRGIYQLSEAGRLLLAGPRTELSVSILNEFSAYTQWKEQSGKSSKPESTSIRKADEAALDNISPEETMHLAFGDIERELQDELLSLLLEVTPGRFERVIVDLLIAMGYGGGDPSMGQSIGKSGDGGIDGIINEDALGLDAVYIQAKRYALDNKVGRPALQAFVGSLTGEGASKGVFVTTSDFSAEAKAYVDRIQQRIVLINGERLARLMIQHEVGVRARKSYVIRSVDEDYFSDT